MSNIARDHRAADKHGPAHAHGAHGAAPSHGSFKGYMTGFVLAVILTAIPFWLVMGRPIPDATVTALLLMGLAVVQIVVHMIYFLHMNTKSEGGWTMLALIFTLVLVAIALTGSMWVMYNLNTNMMPHMSAQAMSQMP
jgi:cytochrome o ubiquinol oxidase operon protein cyoD